MVLISSILSRGSYWLERQKGRLACLMQEIARSAVLWLLCVYHYPGLSGPAIPAVQSKPFREAV
jgi:hypothetical protein